MLKNFGRIFKMKSPGNRVRSTTAIIDNTMLKVSGKWLKLARIFDEDWVETQLLENPERFLARLKELRTNIDIFTFAQRIPCWRPKYSYTIKWENVAAIPITSYHDWWQRVSADMRKDVKRAEKRGVLIREVQLDDNVIKGVVEINNETRVRQGKRFVHYGKSFETVKKEYTTFSENSLFIGAYYGNELIGIVKIVYVGQLACIMEILSKMTHYDKRPTNAMIAKAVELAERERKAYLTYGKFHYGNKTKSTFVEFKRRCGFEKIMYPRYYIPLTIKGKLAIYLRLHLDIIDILPNSVISAFLYLRSLWYRRFALESDQI